MEKYWLPTAQTVQSFLSVTAQALLSGLRYLGSDDPVARLIKDTITAILITAFSSLVIGGYLALRQSRRRAKIERPIRTFVLEAITSAHNGIREAIADFNAFDRKQLKTRLKRLGDQLSKVRAALSPTVVAGFAFFKDEQQTAIAEYLAIVRWDHVATIEDAVARLTRIDAQYRAVMKVCDTNDANGWDDHDFMAMKGDLQRLEPKAKTINAVGTEPTKIRGTERLHELQEAQEMASIGATF